MDNLTKEEKHILWHSLTGSTSKVYRNYYATSTTDIRYNLVRGLVDRGFMIEGRKMTEWSGSMEYYHVTVNGMAAIQDILPDGKIYPIRLEMGYEKQY